MSDQTTITADPTVLEMTVEVVAAYVAKNSIPSSELGVFIASTYASLNGLGKAPAEAAPAAKREPAVPIKKSITDEYLISLEDGRKFKSLKRHLMTHYGLTPAEYRTKWGLAHDYPMVAPAYAAARSTLAKTMGLGAQRRGRTSAAATSGEAVEPATAKKRGRPAKAAA